MAYEINLPSHANDSGKLTVIEKVLPFNIRRVYYIYDVKGSRGGHRHKKTIQALVCVCGSCEIYSNNGKEEFIYKLDRPDKCLIVEPPDWHTMFNFSRDALLLVCASEEYDVNDYIDEAYR